MIYKPVFHFQLVCFAMAKQFTACNWACSRVTETQLNEMVSIGSLPKKTEIKWRVPGTENPPTRQGEVVVFVDHIGRGFKPPGQSFTEMCLPASNFIRKVLVPTRFPIYATSRSSVKYIYKKNQLQNCSGISST